MKMQVHWSIPKKILTSTVMSTNLAVMNQYSIIKKKKKTDYASKQKYKMKKEKKSVELG